MHPQADSNDIPLTRLFESALDCLEEGVVVFDSQLDAPGPKILFVNRGFEVMTGYRAQEVVGRSPPFLQGPRTQRDVLERLFSTLNDRREFQGELVHYRKDGTEFRVHLRVCPVLSDDGQVSHFVAVGRSAVGRKADTREPMPAGFDQGFAGGPETDESARRLNGQLAHIARVNTLGDMAGRLAHELNQPLTAISNYAQGCANRLQAQQIEGTELVRVLDLIRDAALRAGAIVDRLRNFFRRKGPQQVELELPRLIQNQLDLMEPEIRRSRIQVELDIADDLPRVLADEFQIEQVIVNFIRNSLEAMADTPVNERRLVIRAFENSSRQIEVAVIDQGHGLSPEAAARSFEPFFSTKPLGLGMGLAISRSLVQGHGGRLWLDETPGRGACFRFTLPMQHGDE
jgi:PAS domain S-box-containing protein